jgi:hypothetical protein
VQVSRQAFVRIGEERIMVDNFRIVIALYIILFCIQKKDFSGITGRHLGHILQK